MHADGLPAGTSVQLDIDRAKAEAMGVGFEQISSTLSAAMGSQYVNDFPNKGRLQQVILQADAPHRMELEDVLKLYVRNEGGMVALSELVTALDRSAVAAATLSWFPALNLSGAPASGVSTGQAMAEMERLAANCRPASPCSGPASRCRSVSRGAGAVAAVVVDAGGVPGACRAVRELVDSVGGAAGGATGPACAVAAVLLRGMPNDVFFKVGMITVIGLSAKNAILIVEFARQLQQQGAAWLKQRWRRRGCACVRS